MAEEQEIVYGLTDGGYATIDDAKIVALGDRFAHRRITYRHDGGADRPASRITFEIRDGVRVHELLPVVTTGQPNSRSRKGFKRIGA